MGSRRDLWHVRRRCARSRRPSPGGRQSGFLADGSQRNQRNSDLHRPSEMVSRHRASLWPSRVHRLTVGTTHRFSEREGPRSGHRGARMRGGAHLRRAPRYFGLRDRQRDSRIDCPLARPSPDRTFPGAVISCRQARRSHSLVHLCELSLDRILAAPFLRFCLLQRVSGIARFSGSLSRSTSQYCRGSPLNDGRDRIG